jgi:hypothetical protein
MATCLTSERISRIRETLEALAQGMDTRLSGDRLAFHSLAS